MFNLFVGSSNPFAPFVPNSCCKRDKIGQIINEAVCVGAEAYTRSNKAPPMQSPPANFSNEYLNERV